MALHLEIKATYRQGVEENSREEKDEELKKRKRNWEKLRCVWEKNEEREGLKESDKGARKTGWEIRKVEVI